MKQEIKDYYQSELKKRNIRLIVKKDFKTKEEVDEYMKLLDMLQNNMDSLFEEETE